MLLYQEVWELATHCPHGDFVFLDGEVVITAAPQVFRPLFTCSLSSDLKLSSKKAVSEENCDGFRKLSRLKSSSTSLQGRPRETAFSLHKFTAEQVEPPRQQVWVGKWRHGLLGSIWGQFCFAFMTTSSDNIMKQISHTPHSLKSSSNSMLVKAPIHSFTFWRAC